MNLFLSSRIHRRLTPFAFEDLCEIQAEILWRNCIKLFKIFFFSFTDVFFHVKFSVQVRLGN